MTLSLMAVNSVAFLYSYWVAVPVCLVSVYLVSLGETSFGRPSCPKDGCRSRDVVPVDSPKGQMQPS